MLNGKQRWILGMSTDTFVVEHHRFGHNGPVEEWGPFATEADAIAFCDKIAARAGMIVGVDTLSYRHDDATLRRHSVKG